MKYSVMRIPLVGLIVCDVPVLPGTPTAMVDGEPLPLEERTELCAQDAHWMIGMQPVCDHHLRESLALLEDDGQRAWDEIVSECRWGDPDVTPWDVARRHSQEEARRMRDDWKEHAA